MFWNYLLLYEKVDLSKLQPMILKRNEKRSQLYPVRAMVPVANEVLLARNVLTHGVPTLFNSFILMACKATVEGQEMWNLVGVVVGPQNREPTEEKTGGQLMRRQKQLQSSS
ncbi:unnamed protein product [Vicia faba]|uniref:Uncharacterized protein n=1 Tax=Vicia faba TaxID=3906 RepID=A0AAV0Z5F9_VICFA|nr:unnamed protein product [Vicia faba]